MFDIDAVSIGGQDSGSSFNISHTNAGNLMILSTITVADIYSISATYDGDALDSIDFSQNNASVKVQMFYLLSPSIGTFNVVVSNTDNIPIAARVITFIDAHTSTPYGTAGKANGNGNDPSSTAPSAVGDIVIDAVGYAVGGTGTWTPGAGQTEDTFSSSPAVDIRNRGSHETATSTSTVMSWSNDGAATDWASLSVAIKGAAAALDPLITLSSYNYFKRYEVIGY